MLAFLGLALVGVFGYLYRYVLAPDPLLPEEMWRYDLRWVYPGVRVLLFLALYFFVRQRRAGAFRAAAVVLLVLAGSAIAVESYLISISYAIGAYLEYRAGEAVRRLPRGLRDRVPDDILDDGLGE